MTPDRLVELIPFTLQALQPPAIDPRPGNPVKLCEWINRYTTYGCSVQPDTPLGPHWPTLPSINANQYILASAPKIPHLNCHDSGPIEFAHRPGVNVQGQQVPAIERCQSVAGHVIANTGEIAFCRTDFTLPGPLPFRWQRFYRQGNCEDCGLGAGWRHSLSEQLHILEDEVELHSADGRHIRFAMPAIGHSCFNRFERLLLHRQSLHSYRLSGFDQADRIFRADGTGSAVPLMEIRDHCGNAIAVDYRDGLPAKFVSSWGRVVEFIHCDGNIQELRDRLAPDQQQSLCHYGFEQAQQSDLMTSAHAGLHQERYTYRDGRLSSINGVVVGSLHFTHDDQQRCSGVQVNQLQLSLRWRNGNRQCIQSGGGRHPQCWTFDSRGLLLREQQHDRTVSYLYDYYGNLCQETAADGQCTFFRHDELGRPLRKTSNGISDQFIYDKRGFLVAAQCRGISIWHFTHDERGLPGKIIDPCGGQWLFQYNERGQLNRLSDPENGSIDLQWDSQGQLTSIRRGEREWTLDYDHWQRPIRFDLNGDSLSAWQYGRYGELRSAEHLGAEYLLEYDEQGRPCEITNKDTQRVLRWQSDPSGRPVIFFATDCGHWQLHYNHWGQPVAFDYEAGNAEWRYDEFGRLASAYSNGDYHWQWEHETSGALSEFRDNDARWYFHYTESGQVREIRNNSGQSSQFHYDKYQRLVAADNGYSALRFRYDNRNLLVAEHLDSSDAEGVSLKHRYDDRGWLKNSSSDDLDIAYLLAPDSQVYGVDANGEAVLRCEQESSNVTSWVQGSVRSRRLCSGGQLTVLELEGQTRWQFEAEPFPQLPFSLAQGALPLSAEVERDRRGNIASERRPGNHRHDYRYQYDGWGLLTSAECGDFNTYFRYDAFGRRLSKLSTHRRSSQQRRITSHWYALGPWSETVTTSAEVQPMAIYLLHPVYRTLLCRWQDGTTTHYLVNPAGKPLALFDQNGNCEWESSQPPGPDRWRGRGVRADSETGLHYSWCGYWHPQLQTRLRGGDFLPVAGSSAMEQSVEADDTAVALHC
ncbi:DUF6531 domain-containing protein [Microbulbifer hainanensis]|uniref:DUF6531 domain-containing protein n=1 Tax=Microbulbifer hainanensis TaxID=2735675 RepID=UPI001869053C|nr:DUF6531 domain-containing protein [Microbulbifer hainanensis]